MQNLSAIHVLSQLIVLIFLPLKEITTNDLYCSPAYPKVCDEVILATLG